MSDEDKGAEVRTMLDDLRKKTAPLFQQMVDAARATNTAAAKIAGDPITPENEDFWRIAGNLFQAANGELNPAGPEIAALVNLSKAIAVTSCFEDWSAPRGICERLFDELDGGQELGLSDDFINVDWRDETQQRQTALRKGMQFHRVPRSYQAAIIDVVTDLMLATPGSWNHEGGQLPQPWANTCTYVVFAIAERVKGDMAIH